MDNYIKELEGKIVELKKEKETADKHLLTLEWVVGILSCVVLIAPIFMAAYMPIKEWQRILLILGCIIIALIGFHYALKIEQVAGYYECRECGHRYVPTYKEVFLASHMCRTRKMKCPKCGKKSWQKKVLSKD